MENIKLEDCKQITPKQYLELIDPEFKAQSRVDSNGYFWMIFESKGILYSIHNKL